MEIHDEPPLVSARIVDPDHRKVGGSPAAFADVAPGQLPVGRRRGTASHPALSLPLCTSTRPSGADAQPDTVPAPGSRTAASGRRPASQPDGSRGWEAGPGGIAHAHGPGPRATRPAPA